MLPTERKEHPSLGGPFILLTPKGKPQAAYLEVQHISRLITDPDEVRILAARYGSIRARALTPEESLTPIGPMNAEQPTRLDWFKSSYSSGEGGACVEIASGTTAIHVRDSKQRRGPQLAFERSAWSGFVTALGRDRA